MKWIKKILFPVFSLFLLYQTIEIIKQVLHFGANTFSFREILFIAFLLVLYITGIFAFPGFAYPTNQILPSNYYKIKKPEQLKRLYRLIGVNYFRVFLLVLFWRHKKNARKYFDGTRNGLQNFIYQSKQSEFGHFGAFIIICLVCIFLLAFAHLRLLVFITLLNIIANLYPVILQRYHRIRIEKLIAD